MKLVFTGIQWCGKWTQARILEEKFGFKILEMWGEFRKIVSSGTELWNKIKEIIESGAQVNAELWKKVMETAILENDYENIIYDWFIRNEWNIEVFDKLVKWYKVILFELSVEKAKKRLLGRMYDNETWETFPSWTEINPKTGNRLIKRNDDKDENAILKRISEYEEKTLPVLEKQKAEWKVIVINADQSIEKVNEDLIKWLGL